MTCVVGVVHDGKVYLAADSAGISGMDLRIRTDKKVFEVDEFVIGIAGSFRMGNILRFSFNPPIHHEDVDPFHYMATDFIDEVRHALKDGGYSKKDNNVETTTGGTFLVGYRGRLFEIDSDFQVAENVHGYAAIGCGDQVALGSLFSTDDFDNPEDRLEEALEAAEAFSAGVRAPFNFISTTYREN